MPPITSLCNATCETASTSSPNVGSSIGTLAKTKTRNADAGTTATNLPARETACRRPRGEGSWTSIFPGQGPPIGRRWRYRCGERRAGTQRGWPSLRRKAEKWSERTRDAAAKDRPIMKTFNATRLKKRSKQAEDTDPQPPSKQSNMKITTALLAIVSATPLAEGFVGNNAQNFRSQHARFSTTVDISAPSASSSTSVSATLPSPEESAQALQDYMVKAHEDKARAVREIEEKSRARIKVRPNVKVICLGLRRQQSRHVQHNHRN